MCAMSTKVATADAAGTQGSGGPSMVMTLVVVIVGVWIGLAGAGGGLYYMVRSGKILLGSGAVSGGAAKSGKETHAIVLEPILVNLADDGGHAYLRLGVTVDILDDPAVIDAKPGAAGSEAAKGSKKSELENSVRDTVLTVLGRQTSAALLGPDGKEHLKIELKEAIERGSIRLNVKDLFFTDFLVQI